MYFGSHMSIAGGFEGAVERAVRVGCESLQIFVKSSRQWRARPLLTGEPRAFQEALAASPLREAVAHNCYLTNLASPDGDLWRRSKAATLVEMERCAALGLERLVIHPGSHLGSGIRSGIHRLALALDELKESAGERVRILLETTAGHGTSIGFRFEHLRDVLAAVRDEGWLGVCLDTCHVYAAGHDISGPAGYEAMMAAIEKTVGIERVEVLHVNDSQGDCGSRVDRHAHIGEGGIGLDGFRRFVRDPRWWDRPFILETPKGPGLREDRRNLRRLRRLAPR